MLNLRLMSVKVVDSTNITAIFSDKLVQTINTTNIAIEPQSDRLPTPNILSTNVIGNTLRIVSQPLTQLSTYTITFRSTINSAFKSLNGTSILFEDGITNIKLITGPIEANNPFKILFNNYFADNVFELDDESLVGKLIQSFSILFSKGLFDIRQVKNENYLSFKITDELITRSAGPSDRLTEESAYEVLRVGKGKTGIGAADVISFDEFPSDPISLQKIAAQERLTVFSSDIKGTFNFNDFTLNLSNNFISKLTGITFTFNNGFTPYIYDIETLGYQIKDSKYDTLFSSTYFILTDNQIKISDKILEDPLFALDKILFIDVEFEYKNLGKIIDQSSVKVKTSIASVREVLPPIINVFSLKHAPIIDSSDQICITDGVSFTDPNQLSKSHPAFLYELPFRYDYLPSKNGEYSIDYETGTVYVFGSDKNNDGTGAFPPLATYNYRLVFKSGVDYIYDEDNFDLVSLPNGALLNNSAKVVFNYEEVLTPGIDFKADVHKEILSERINNNIKSLNSIAVANIPITNVFRILNETSGEIYNLIRWSDDTVYFNYNTAPRIISTVGERASFETISNELLFVTEVLSTSISNSKIFKILLQNNNIISGTEDSVGSSFNTSVNFSNAGIFTQELYFSATDSRISNLARFTEEGQYQIDYINGIVYVLVSDSQDIAIGNINYKRGFIVTNNKHIISVDDIYTRINLLVAKSKNFEYSNFTDTTILPTTIDVADECFLNSEKTIAYLLSANKIGAIVDGSFSAGVKDSVSFIRSVYEIKDLKNNIYPINFASVSTFENKIITVGTLTYTEYHAVQKDEDNQYYITLNSNINYLSSNITITLSAIRTSDSLELYNSSVAIETGNPTKIILTEHSPQLGDSVNVTYSFIINNLSGIAVNYSSGDLLVDYTYLADEIIVSYEYGDNIIDFRESNSLSEGDQYYVTYKVGALRSALFNNFGSSIDIPILNTFDVSFERERYRDALEAVLQSFTNGPTITSIKNIVEKISHVPPEIIESAFQNWSLGHSLLNPEKINTTGEFNLLPAKYGNGVLINKEGQSITLPAFSNLRIEEGTIGGWIIPEWNGIDNDSIINIKITKNGLYLKPSEIFIGASEYHPTYEVDYSNNTKSIILHKSDQVDGSPNKNKDGVFIYYDKDPGGKFSRWYLEIRDGYDGYDGYCNFDGYENDYKILINTDGKFYDVKPSISPKPLSTKIISGTNTINFGFYSCASPLFGITFVSDFEHYLFDYGKLPNKNRISVFKDASGYINFRVFDKNKNLLNISADVSAWKSNEKHHVAASWNLNSKNRRDELHLFIDGIETPNIIRYGGISAFLHEKFRTINPEESVGVITKNIVQSTDLTVTSGSAIVTSSLNFTNEEILFGDTLYIDESGFDINGYSILDINGNSLTLNTSMPLTLQGNGKFSVNKTSFNSITEIDIYNNIAVSVVHSVLDGSDLKVWAESNLISSVGTNFSTNNVEPGFLIRIIGGTFEKHYVIISVEGHNLILNDTMPLTSTGLSWFVYDNEETEIPGVRALTPAYEISRDTDENPVLTIRGSALKNDIVLIRTLGLNHKKVKQRYYVWGNNSNVIKTKLPPPIALNQVNIFHILLPFTAIGSSNSTLSSGIFTSNDLSTQQPSSSDTGRTLSITISSDNINFSTPVVITIVGNVLGILTTETINFTEIGTKISTNKFETINHIKIVGKPILTNKNLLTIELKEKYSITYPESSTVYPAIRYSYQVKAGNSLVSDGTINLTDTNRIFTSSDVGNYLYIHSPAPAVGYYKIVSIASDHKGFAVDSAISTFVSGVYEILNVSLSKTGFQNGFFTLEAAAQPGQPYDIKEGLYEFEYFTYLSAPFDPINSSISLGTDYLGSSTIDSIIDEIKINSIKYTDIRIGETSSIQNSITKDFNSLKPLKKDINTLALIHFDDFPFTNDSDFYISSTNKYIQSGKSVNENFNQSIVITDTPIVLDNLGILNTKTEGTIEFWINPIYDTANDPSFRFYFDASGVVSESVKSDTNGTVVIAGRASQILSVKLKIGDQKINYFSGGSISEDMQTLVLGKALPNQQTPVIVNYIPNGVKGDRISIYKDPQGYINFNLRANGLDYQVRSPTYWLKNTWHRVKASYKINGGQSRDEIRLFIDGFEKGNILFGSGLLFGQALVFGSTFEGQGSGILTDLKFSDTINEVFIGSDYSNNYGACALIDNFRISNISRPIYQPFGESIDVNYNSNTDIVYPVTEDLYTTLLLNFETLLSKNDDFSTLKNKNTGIFDFTVKIFDSFGIVTESQKVKEVLETLIKTLKPANSRVFIKYIK